MAIPTVYRSTDSGAPQIHTNTAGSYVDMLRACLVDGYGSKAAAGWSEPFTGTNVSVFQNSTAAGGTGMCVRVSDTDTATGSGVRLFTLNGYRTMSDINTGTDGLTQRQGSRRPANSNGVVDWITVATPTAFYTCLYQGAVNQVYPSIQGGGDIRSFMAADAYRYFTLGVNSGGTTSPGWLGGNTGEAGSGGYSPSNAVPLGADETGLVKNLMYGLWPQWTYQGSSYVGGTAYPARPSVTGADEAVVPAYLARLDVLRGRLPGLYIPVASLHALSIGDTIDDVAGPGSRLMLLRSMGITYGGGNSASIWVETALDWG